MLFTRRLMLGLAMAGSMLGALAVPAMAEGPTEIDLFFPVPVDGKLARDMSTLIKEFNEGHPNIKATAALAENAKIPVIASGGVTSMYDIMKLMEAAPMLDGAIIGRALYEGFDLGAALKALKEA